MATANAGSADPCPEYEQLVHIACATFKLIIPA